MQHMPYYTTLEWKKDRMEPTSGGILPSYSFFISKRVVFLSSVQIFVMPNLSEKWKWKGPNDTNQEPPWNGLMVYHLSFPFFLSKVRDIRCCEFMLCESVSAGTLRFHKLTDTSYAKKKRFGRDAAAFSRWSMSYSYRKLGWCGTRNATTFLSFLYE